MMNVHKGFVILCLVACIRCDCSIDVCDIDEFDSTTINSDQLDRDQRNRNVAESQMSAQIIALLEHYKQTDPIGMPGDFIADPFPVPDSKQSLPMASTLTTTNALAHGLSKFRIKNIALDVHHMLIKAEIEFDEVRVVGNYTLSSLFSSAQGPFFVTLTHIVATGNASIAVELDGIIRTQNILLDVNFANLTMDFKNLGVVGKFFQSIINDSPDSVFDTMKPYMLQDAYAKMRTEIDSNIDDWMAGRKLPNSISPLDVAIGEGRRRVREMHFDPLIIRNYNHTIGLFTIQLRNTWINGVSGFYRIGDVLLNLDNNTVSMGLSVSTQQIVGASDWEISLGRGIITRTGHIKFDVEFIRASVNMSQTLDTRNHPQVNDFQLEIGNIQVRSDGAGIVDYVIEFFINVLPNLLRYQIMDAIELPIRAKIQNEFNQINVERLIRSKIPTIEQMSKNSALNLDKFEL